MARAFRTLALLSAVALAAGCSVQDTPGPALTGPSELALSLTVAATPDTIAQDGSAQTLVVVLARDAGGRAIANLSLRFDVVRDGNIVDFGVLSAKTALTGGDGRAQVVYTAPAPPQNSPTPSPMPSMVSVLATPTGANYANAVPRSVDIRLVPPGTVYDPGTGPAADFLVDGKEPLPASPVSSGLPVVFDAKASSSPAGLVSYVWDFGDGTTGSGVTLQHTYPGGGTFYVRLTVTDKKGQTAWRTKSVTVASGPTAVFAWSQPIAGTPYQVDFNGSGSWPVPPAAKIDTWAWDFGSPACPRVTGPAPALSCQYSTDPLAAPGKTYTVTLTVTDDKKMTGSVSQVITLK